jgi:hypothetical protein
LLLVGKKLGHSAVLNIQKTGIVQMELEKNRSEYDNCFMGDIYCFDAYSC